MTSVLFTLHETGTGTGTLNGTGTMGNNWDFPECFHLIQWIQKQKYQSLKGLEPTTFCVRDQDATTAPARQIWETGSLNWAQFLLRWFIRSLDSLNSMKVLLHLGKTPIGNKESYSSCLYSDMDTRFVYTPTIVQLTIWHVLYNQGVKQEWGKILDLHILELWNIVQARMLLRSRTHSRVVWIYHKWDLFLYRNKIQLFCSHNWRKNRS